MAIPDYQTVMLPLLRVLADNNEYKIHEAAELIADKFGLTDEEKEELLPSGQGTVIRSRVGWAKTYMKNAGLVQQPKRGVMKITEEGLKVLREQPEKIGNTFLERYPSYIAFRDKGLKNRKARAKASTEEVVAIETQTPEELLESSHDALRSALADELLEQLHGSSWKFFEKIVVEVLVAMGYGGSIEDAGQAMCKSNDGGIDGVIKEDRLGLDVVVVQAKQWKEERSVGRPEVQGFAGSMEPYRARKGVFITTSTFSKLACDYVKECERKIVLIDGTAPANYMIDFDVGVTTYKTYMVKRVDSDFFEE